MFTRLRGMVNTVSNQIVTNDDEERPDNGESMVPEEYTAGHEQGSTPDATEGLGTDQLLHRVAHSWQCSALRQLLIGWSVASGHSDTIGCHIGCVCCGFGLGLA